MSTRMKIGAVVNIRDGFVPNGCTGPAASRGVVVDSGIAGQWVYVPAWQTTALFYNDQLTATDDEPTKDEREAVEQAIANRAE